MADEFNTNLNNNDSLLDQTIKRRQDFNIKDFYSSFGIDEQGNQLNIPQGNVDFNKQFYSSFGLDFDQEQQRVNPQNVFQEAKKQTQEFVKTGDPGFLKGTLLPGLKKAIEPASRAAGFLAAGPLGERIMKSVVGSEPQEEVSKAEPASYFRDLGFWKDWATSSPKEALRKYKAWASGPTSIVRGLGGSSKLMADFGRISKEFGKTPFGRMMLLSNPQFQALNNLANDKLFDTVEAAGDSVTNYSKIMEDTWKVEDPKFTDKLAAGIGSMTSFMMMGAAVSGLSKVANLSPAISKVLGIATATATEALTEAGNTRENILQDGGSKEFATKGATASLLSNLALIGITNKFGIFGESKQIVKRVLGGFFNEGIQEGAQEFISHLSEGKPLKDFDWLNFAEAVGIGGLIGGGASTVSFASDKDAEIRQEQEFQKALPEFVTFANNLIDNLSPEQKKKLTEEGGAEELFGSNLKELGMKIQADEEGNVRVVTEETISPEAPKQPTEEPQEGIEIEVTEVPTEKAQAKETSVTAQAVKPKPPPKQEAQPTQPTTEKVDVQAQAEPPKKDKDVTIEREDTKIDVGGPKLKETEENFKPIKAPKNQNIDSKAWDVQLSRKPKTDERINRSQIISHIQKKFGVPVKGKSTKRMSKNAAAHFEVRPEVIRSRNFAELEPVAHEVGHFIDKNLNKEIKGWKNKYSSELEKLDYDPTMKRIDEGFSEYFRLLITTDKASNVAPQFHKFFNEEILSKRPDLKDNIIKLKDMYRIWDQQGSKARGEAQIDFAGEQEKSVQTLRETAVKAVENFQTKFVDELAPLKNLSKEFEKRTGRKLRPSEDPFEVATFKKLKSSSIARTFLTKDTVDKLGNVTGDSLSTIMKPIKDNEMKDFMVYALAKITKNEAKRGIETGLEIADADQIIKESADDSKRYNEVLKDLTSYSHRLLDYMVDTGVLNKDQAKIIKEAHPIYLPLRRVFLDLGNRFGLGQKGIANQGKAVKRRKGSTRPIQNMMEGLVQNTYEEINKANKAAVSKTLIDIAEAEGMGGLITPIDPQTIAHKFDINDIPGLNDILELAEENNVEVDEILTLFTQSETYRGKDNIYSFWKDGKRKFYEIDPSLNEILQGVNPQNLGPMLRAFTLATQAVRIGATSLNVGFAFANLIRDYQTYLFNSKDDRGAFKRTGELAKSIFNGMFGDQKSFEKRFKAAGGELSGLAGFDRNATINLTEEILANRIGLKDRLKSFVEDPRNLLKSSRRFIPNVINSIQELISIGEIGPRAAEGRASYERYLRENPDWTEEDAFIKAFNDAQDITVNFTRSGTVLKNVNKFIPFVNARAQGLDKFLRTVKEDPKKAMTRGMMYFGAPAVLYWLAANDKEWYENMPFEMRYNAYYIEDPNTGEVIKIPINNEVAALFTTPILASLDAMKQTNKGKKILDAWGKQILDAIPITPNFYRNIALFRPVLDIRENKNYRGLPIEPERMKRLWHTERYLESTPKYARQISKAIDKVPLMKNFFKLSPIQIDYLVNNYTGGLFRQFPKDSKFFNRSLGYWPILGRFFLRSKSKPMRQQAEFWEEYKELEQKYNAKILNKEQTQRYRVLKEYKREMMKNGGLLEKRREIVKKIQSDDFVPNDDARLEKVDSKIRDLLRSYDYGDTDAKYQELLVKRILKSGRGSDEDKTTFIEMWDKIDEKEKEKTIREVLKDIDNPKIHMGTLWSRAGKIRRFLVKKEMEEQWANIKDIKGSEEN